MSGDNTSSKPTSNRPEIRRQREVAKLQQVPGPAGGEPRTLPTDAQIAEKTSAKTAGRKLVTWSAPAEGKAIQELAAETEQASSKPWNQFRTAYDMGMKSAVPPDQGGWSAIYSTLLDPTAIPPDVRQAADRVAAEIEDEIPAVVMPPHLTPNCTIFGDFPPTYPLLPPSAPKPQDISNRDGGKPRGAPLPNSPLIIRPSGPPPPAASGWRPNAPPSCSPQIPGNPPPPRELPPFYFINGTLFCTGQGGGPPPRASDIPDLTPHPQPRGARPQGGWMPRSPYGAQVGGLRADDCAPRSRPVDYDLPDHIPDDTPLVPKVGTPLDPTEIKSSLARPYRSVVGQPNWRTFG